MKCTKKCPNFGWFALTAFLVISPLVASKFEAPALVVIYRGKPLLLPAQQKTLDGRMHTLFFLLSAAASKSNVSS